MVTAGITTAHPSVPYTFSTTTAVATTSLATPAAGRQGDGTTYGNRGPLATEPSAAPGESTGATPSSAAYGTGSGRQAATAVHNVEFVYDGTGTVKIKFMDSRNNTIYQLPPELYDRMSSLLGKGRASVSTRV